MSEESKRSKIEEILKIKEIQNLHIKSPPILG